MKIAGGFDPQATLHGVLGSVHVCFRVWALDLQTWAEHGYPVTWAQCKAGPSLYVRDPAGNLVELAPAAIWGLPDGAQGIYHQIRVSNLLSGDHPPQTEGSALGFTKLYLRRI